MTDEGLNCAVNQEIAAEVPQEQDTMEDLWKSFIQDKYLAVRQPAIDTNDFELKPALITTVQQVDRLSTGPSGFGCHCLKHIHL